MILTDKDKATILFKCICGCAGIEIDKSNFNNVKEYYISNVVSTFDSDQDGLFYKLKKRIKMAWYILRHGTHRYQEIFLTEADFNELKEVIRNYE